MQEVLVGLVLILFAIWIAWRWKLTSRFSSAGIPGPKPSLLFGNILELYRKGPIKCHEEWVKKYGRIVGYYYGMKPILLVADPQMLKTIYIKDFSKFVDREPFNPIESPNIEHKDELNHTVLLLRGQKWKEVRSVLTPTFTISKMKQMATMMNSSIDLMLSILKEKAKSSKVIDIYDTYQRLTVDVISRTAFGVLIDIQKNPDSKILRANKLIFRESFYSSPLFIGLCFPLLREFALRCQILIGTVLNRGVKPFTALNEGLQQVLDHRRKNKESRKVDLLQLMIDSKIKEDAHTVDVRKLEAGAENEIGETSEDNSKNKTRSMTDKEIVASSVTVFLAGYETTSTAMGFTTFLLAKHQDVQEKVFEEINELVKNGGKLEYATINKLPYLEKVLNESMRIYPPVYLFTNRYALEDVQYGQLKIPKGTIVQAPTHLLHHDPEFWQDPETFDPERFASKPNADGITFFPFGIGPRNCLGMRFAQMEAKLGLAHTIHSFRLRLADEQQNDLPISLRMRTLSPTNGVKVTLEIRRDETDL